MARPSVDLDWAENDVVDPTSGQNNKVEPPAAWKNNGWSYQEKPPRNYDNYHKWLTGQWVKYLDDSVVRAATYVVAASDAAAGTKEHADAVCDGTDDQVEINAAITAVAATGGVVMLSEGEFSVSGAITMSGASGVHLRGHSHGATLIKIASGTSASFNMIDIIGGVDTMVSDLQMSGNSFAVTGDNNGINANDGSSLVVRNVQINVMNRSASAGHAIVLENAANLARITGCYLFGHEGSGIKTDATALYPRVSGVIAENCDLAGFDVGGAGRWTTCMAIGGAAQGFLVPGHDGALANCMAKSNGTNGFEITGDDVSLSVCRADGNTGRGIELSGNRCHAGGCKSRDSTQEGLYISGLSNTADGCTVSGGDADGIMLSAADYARVTGCVSTSNDHDGVIVTGACTNCAVADCTVDSNSRATHDTYYGINVDSASDCIFKDNLVRLGPFSPQQKWGIGGSALTGGANTNVVSDNDFKNGGFSGAIETSAQAETIPQYAWDGSAHQSHSIADSNRIA